MNTPKFGPQMGEDARKAALAAFDAMSDWRNDMQTSAERHGTKVFDRMTAAAKASAAVTMTNLCFMHFLQSALVLWRADSTVFVDQEQFRMWRFCS